MARLGVLQQAKDDQGRAVQRAGKQLVDYGVHNAADLMRTTQEKIVL